MESLRDFVRGVHSLGMGCPYYRHVDEKLVPWPHLDNPLRNNPPGEVVDSWERVIGREELKREISRLGKLNIPDEEVNGPILSHFITKPLRVTYSTHIPLRKMDLVSRGNKHTWRVCSPDFPGHEPDSPFPGYACIRELRVRGRVDRVELKLGSKLRTVQVFRDPIHLLSLLQKYLGMEVITGDILTLPFFFSRDPCYALPLFVAGRMELDIYAETPPELFATFDLLHGEEEISQIRKNHRHRVEDVDRPIYEIDRYLFMGTFWKYLGQFPETDRVRLDYEGGVDEEIRGVFWEGVPDEDVGVFVEYEGGDYSTRLVDQFPAHLLAQLELRTKLLPTLGGSRYTPVSERPGYGGILFSRGVDSTDCEPGLTPRHGSLVLGFSRKITPRVFLLTSRDVILS
jgi:hypothetical protein